MRYLIFLILLINSCGIKKNQDYKVIVSSNDQLLNRNSSINLSIETLVTTDFNVTYYLNGKKINSKATLSNSRLGSNTIDAILSTDDNQITISKKIDVFSTNSPKLYTYEILNEFNHDISAYTQGLEFQGEYLYESTGLNGYSSIKKIDLFNDKIIETRFLDKQYFGEGLTIINNKIIQLTWKSKVGFIYNLETFEMERSFNYGKSIVGWGLANDGTHIFKSDGTEKIWVLDSNSYEEIDYLEVVTNNKKIKNINELEVVDNQIYANTYQFNNDVCVIIDKDSGEVTGLINFKGLRERVKNHPELDVLNGIAYNKRRKTFFVTGKKWNKIFEIRILLAK
tara:strand:+ start:75 stop:1091 length:1017 start_codon:yes stop_codon:yes gene_type:complete